jgi:hypothetical protein
MLYVGEPVAGNAEIRNSKRQLKSWRLPLKLAGGLRRYDQLRADAAGDGWFGLRALDFAAAKGWNGRSA